MTTLEELVIEACFNEECSIVNDFISIIEDYPIIIGRTTNQRENWVDQWDDMAYDVISRHHNSPIHLSFTLVEMLQSFFSGEKRAFKNPHPVFVDIVKKFIRAIEERVSPIWKHCHVYDNPNVSLRERFNRRFPNGLRSSPKRRRLNLDASVPEPAYTEPQFLKSEWEELSDDDEDDVTCAIPSIVGEFVEDISDEEDDVNHYHKVTRYPRKIAPLELVKVRY